MTSKKLLVVFMATFFLFSNVYGYGITPGSKDFDVIANKTYSDDFCIIDTVKGQTYYLSYEPSPLLFEEFSTEFDSYTSSKNGEKICVDFSFIVKSPKNVDSDSHKIHIMVTKSDPDNPGFVKFGTAFRIDINSIEIGYKNALLELSYKFVLFFVSIFAMLGLLLYMIKNKKLNE